MICFSKIFLLLLSCILIIVKYLQLHSLTVAVIHVTQDTQYKSMDVIMKNEKKKKVILRTPQLKELCGSTYRNVNSHSSFSITWVREEYLFQWFLLMVLWRKKSKSLLFWHILPQKGVAGRRERHSMSLNVGLKKKKRYCLGSQLGDICSEK